MATEFKPSFEPVEPMGRRKFFSMTPQDQKAFIELGGTLLDDPPEPREPEQVAGANGTSLSREEWDALTPAEQWRFLGVEVQYPQT